MQVDKVFAHISNLVTVLVIGALMALVIWKVPDAKWAGTIIGTGLGGLVGYLKGISTAKAQIEKIMGEK